MFDLKEFLKDNDKILRKKKYDDNRHWVKEQTKQYQIWYHLYKKCNSKNIPFDLTPEDIEITDVCPIFNVSFEEKGPNSPTIDKIIPEKGYVKGNICMISNRANRIKDNGTAEEHRLIAKYIDDWA